MIMPTLSKSKRIKRVYKVFNFIIYLYFKLLFRLRGLSIVKSHIPQRLIIVCKLWQSSAPKYAYSGRPQSCRLILLHVRSESSVISETKLFRFSLAKKFNVLPLGNAIKLISVPSQISCLLKIHVMSKTSTFLYSYDSLQNTNNCKLDM